MSTFVKHPLYNHLHAVSAFLQFPTVSDSDKSFSIFITLPCVWLKKAHPLPPHQLHGFCFAGV